MQTTRLLLMCLCAAALELRAQTAVPTGIPFVRETTESKVDDATTRSTTVTRAHAPDGTTLDLQTATTTTHRTDAGVIEKTTDITARGIGGGVTDSQRITQTITPTATGTQLKSDTFRRQPDGSLVLQRAVTATTTTNATGAIVVASTIQDANLQGTLVSSKQIDETTVTRSDTEKEITRQIRTVDHLNGEFQVTGKERTLVNGPRSETTRQFYDGTGWRPVGRTVTTTTTAPDGSTQRETIDEAEAVTEQYSAAPTESLVPKRKIVDHETRTAAGAVVTQREVFRRNVNGDWQAETFIPDRGPLSIND